VFSALIHNMLLYSRLPVFCHQKMDARPARATKKEKKYPKRLENGYCAGFIFPYY